MADQWYYRLFGEEFGPMPIEELRELAKSGTISGHDEVRSDAQSDWVPASKVEALGIAEPELEIATSIDEFAPTEAAAAKSSSSGDEWFCMMAGSLLGPMSFDELAKHAEDGHLGADDQVKLGKTGKWRRVGSIGRLMAVLPYTAVEKKITRTPPKQPEMAFSIEEINISDEQQSTEVYDEYEEDEEEEYEEQEEQEEFDELPDIRDSAPVAPAQPQPIAKTVESVVVDTQAAFSAAYEQAKIKIAESMIAQAEAAFKSAEDQAKAQIAWAYASNVDKYWWGWAGGVEFGPVEFNQVFGLAKTGQLKPSDFIRNGQHAQYAPASNVPGMFSAIAMIAKASETLNLARSQAQAAASLAAPAPVVPMDLLKSPVAPTLPIPAPAPVSQPVASQSNPAISVPAPKPRSNPAVAAVAPPEEDDSLYKLVTGSDDLDLETRPSRPASPTPPPPSEPRSYGSYSPPASMGGGFGSSSSSTMSTYGMNRPAPASVKPAYKKKAASSDDGGWFSDMMENLKEPKAMGSICAVSLILLIFGWQYLPKSRGADIKRYNQIKQIVDEIRAKRSSAPGDLKGLEQKLQAAAKTMAADLKNKASREEPAKQCLLWATRDEVPRVLNAGLIQESGAEKALVARLQEAAYELGLEKRPPIDPVALAKAAQD